MSKPALHIQSKESRERIINQFCRLIAISSLVSVVIYIFLEMYLLSFITGFIGVLFLYFLNLNKKGKFKVSRAAIVITTNLGILFFSLYLGFESGIYLYLYVTPLLIYLLYDFDEKKGVAAVFACYLSTFLAIYLIPQFVKVNSALLDPNLVKLIYSFNFCSAFALCFGIVTYFANNNSRYIVNLIKHQTLLMKEAHLRVESEEKLKKSLKEREVLLGEIHHRVKNNLAIISALISMQMDNLKEDSSKRIFEDTKGRIYAMSLIHNQLYHNKSFAKIEFSQYVRSFCANIAQSYQAGRNIEIEQLIEDIEIDIKTAIPLALIINELITNSFKHAFSDQQLGKITIGLMQMENDFLKCWISDTGIGMKEEIVQNGGMGMDIVTSLTEQIDGKLTYEKSNGSNFTLIFPACTN